MKALCSTEAIVFSLFARLLQMVTRMRLELDTAQKRIEMLEEEKRLISLAKEKVKLFRILLFTYWLSYSKQSGIARC